MKKFNNNVIVLIITNKVYTRLIGLDFKSLAVLQPTKNNEIIIIIKQAFFAPNTPN